MEGMRVRVQGRTLPGDLGTNGLTGPERSCPNRWQWTNDSWYHKVPTASTKKTQYSSAPGRLHDGEKQSHVMRGLPRARAVSQHRGLPRNSSSAGVVAVSHAPSLNFERYHPL